MQKRGLRKIWGMFIFFMVIFILATYFNLRIGDNPTSTMWLFLALSMSILSIIILFKHKLPSKKQIIIALFFGIATLIAYIPHIIFHRTIVFSAIHVPIVTILCSLAFFKISNIYVKNAIKLIRKKSKISIFITIGIGLAVGIIWGIGNLFLNNNEPSLNITIFSLFSALSPGIYEEIAFRALIYSICIYLLNGEIRTKKEQFTLWFMMVVPHVLIHTPEMYMVSLINGLISTILLTVLFGFPFAILQRKLDLTSAMIAHGVVVLIRFSFFGIPGISG
jgi:hypothetical protein